MKYCLTMAAFAVGALVAHPFTLQAQEPEEIGLIRMTFGTEVVEGRLFDTPPSRDLLALMPIVVPMSRLGEREYAGQPSPSLSTAGERQQGFANGDIGYWAPGGYLAVFYDETQDQSIENLIVMGEVTSGLDAFWGGMDRSYDVLIEQIETLETE